MLFIEIARKSRNYFLTFSDVNLKEWSDDYKT